MTLRYSLILIGFLGASNVSQAQSAWTAIDEIDAFTDEEVKAVFYEDDTHRIQISKENDKAIAMYLVLKQGTFEPKTTLELRVDKNPMNESKPMSKMLDEVMVETMGMAAYRWTPKTLVLLFASIDGLNPTNQKDIDRATSSCSSRIVQFLNGERLIGRYHVSDTRRATFNVSLEGFREAAHQVFDIGEVHDDNPHCLR